MNNLPPSLQTALTEFLLFLPSLISAIIVFILTLFAAALIRNAIRKMLTLRQSDPQVVSLVSSLVRWSVLVLGTITALAIARFDVTAFVAGLGVLGVAAGFALQDTLANFVAGILLLIQHPFKTGDLIDAGGFFGEVQEVDLRATRLTTPEGKDILIPNSTVLGGPITNWTLSPLLRASVDVGVSYLSDLKQVEDTALAAVADSPGLVKNPVPPFVWFHTFGASSIDLTVHFWIDTRVIHYNEARDEAVKRIKLAFEQAGIEIPYPVQVVQLTQTT